MKQLPGFLLAGSLVLNAAFAALLVAGASRQAPAPAAPPARASAPRDSAPEITAWPELAAGDMPALVTRLREAGVPPNILRAIITTQVAEQMTARRKAIEPDADSRPFWKGSTLDVSVQNQLRQLYREQQKIVRDLLGADADPDDPMTRARENRQFGFLPPGKLADARRITREFNDLRSDLFSNSAGTITTTDREKLNALDRQMQAEFRKIMTPQEFADYELRGSNTANSLRFQLAAFDPTEAEFRSLFQLQKAFDDRFGQLYSQPSQEEMRVRGEAQKQLNEQIKATLGPVRAADYERATNYEYRNTSQLVARLQLPPETTNQVYDVQKSIQERIGSIYRANPSEAERNQQLAQLDAEAQAKITGILGPRGFEAYKQYGGSWMQSLRPRPPGAPSGGTLILRPAPGR